MNCPNYEPSEKMGKHRPIVIETITDEREKVTVQEIEMVVSAFQEQLYGLTRLVLGKD